MHISDLVQMARQNLWRMRVRTFLTLIGVTVGISALIAMVSFGVGLEKNITENFKNNDLFTSLTISSKAFQVKGGHPSKMNTNKEQADAIPLNDSLITLLQARKDVSIAYPKINTPVRIALGTDTAATTTGCLPMEMGQHAPYDNLLAGKYFSHDSAQEVLVSLSFLNSMGYNVIGTGHKQYAAAGMDSNMVTISADSLIGKKITVLSTALKTSSPLALIGGIENVLAEEATEMTIVGILPSEQFAGPNFREEIIMPLKTAEQLPSVGFDRISEMMAQKLKGNKYNAIFVKAKSMDDLKSLKAFLDEKDINYFAIDDGLNEMKKVFLILDSILGVIGLISLVVAGFGIVNTMLMSILERKREIGIMKAVGGKNRDIRLIFFFEAGIIGVLGALSGIAVGYGLTRIANIIVNQTYISSGSTPLDLFSFPWWLTLGAIAFCIIISLIAGLYPAITASKINPIEALRQEG